MLRWRLAVCGPLAVVVIVMAMVPAAQFPGWQWLSLLLAGIVAVWGAWPLHQAAWAGLGHGAATMDTLVSVGVTASFGWSLYALLFGGADMPGMRMSYSLTFAPASGHTLYLDVAAGVTAAVLTGRYLEARAKRQSGSALSALAGLAAKTVAVLRDGTEQRVPVTVLAAGDRFVVRPGEKIAADGVVLDGRSAVDASLVTGESMPAEVGPGDEVIGSCVSMSGRLVVQASRVGADTLLAQITRLVSQAQMSKAAAQRLADRIAAVFVLRDQPCRRHPRILARRGAARGRGLERAIAVLVVACPCALGLATPTALLAGVGRGAQLGILVKSVHALESAQRIRIVVLDKTGTLTSGTMTVQDIITHRERATAGRRREGGAPAGRRGRGRVRASHRPGHRPPSRGPPRRPAPGHRLHQPARGRRTRERDRAGGHRRQRAVPRRAGAGHRRRLPGRRGGRGKRRAHGRTGRLGRPARGALVVADVLRPGAQAAVARLQRLGLRPVLLTGDNERTAQVVAAQLAIPPDSVVAGVRPDGKAAVVRQFQEAGGRVAMVGDGVNDAAALAQADLGMAVGTGTDAAIGAADLTLVSGTRPASPTPSCWPGPRCGSSAPTSPGRSATTWSPSR